MLIPKIISKLLLVSVNVQTLKIAVIVLFSAVGLMSRQTLAEENPPNKPIEKHFTVEDIPELSVSNLPGQVVVTEGAEEKVTVKISGSNSLEQIKLEQNGSLISIKGNDQAGANAVSITSDNNQIIINTASPGRQKIIVNGEDISHRSDSGQKTAAPLTVSVEVPAGSKGKFSNVDSLKTLVNFDEVQLELNGASTALLQRAAKLDLSANGSTKTRVKAARQVKAKLSGVSSLNVAQLSEGDLNAALSGSSKISAHGKFKNLSITTSGSCQSSTFGLVNGDFRAHAGGASRVIHTGPVRGEIDQQKSGAAQIEIRN
jgi:hypothetical protein